MAAILSDEVEMGSSDALSRDVLLEVAKHLSTAAWQHCRLVCKQWRDIFSLAVTSVAIQAHHKLAHTVRHLQFTFPRLQAITLHLYSMQPQDAHAILTALAGQQSLSSIRVRSHEVLHRNVFVTGPLLLALPTSIRSLHTNTHRWCDADYQALATLTGLTSLSLVVHVADAKTFKDTTQQVANTLAALPLQVLHVTLQRQPQNRQCLDACLLEMVTGCLLNIPTLQQTSFISDLELNTDLIASLKESVLRAASASPPQVSCTFGHGQEVLITAAGATSRRAHMAIRIHQPHHLVSVADHQFQPAHVLAMQPQEIRLTCTLCSNVEATHIDIDLQRLPGLQQLSVSLTSAGILSRQLDVMLFNASQLQHLETRNHCGYTKNMSILGSLVAKCPHLKSLTLHECTADVQVLVQLTCLTGLTISWSQPSRALGCVFDTAWLPGSLRTLSLTACLLVNRSPKAKPQLTSLESVELDACHFSCPGVIQAFSTALQALQLVQLRALCDVTEIVMSAAALFSQLSRLVWAYDEDQCTEARPPLSADRTLHCISALSQLKHLYCLEMPRALYTADAIACLKAMTQLETLCLSVVPATAHGVGLDLKQLAGLPCLKHVHISCEGLSNEEVTDMKHAFELGSQTRHITPEIEVVIF